MRFYHPMMGRQHLPLQGEPRQREHIPQQPGRQQAMTGFMPGNQPGNGAGLGSQGMFGQYMSQLFNQKYAPPMMQGSPLQNYGGFFGFGSPKMNPLQQAAPQQPTAPGRSPQNDPGMSWGEYLNAGS